MRGQIKRFCVTEELFIYCYYSNQRLNEAYYSIMDVCYYDSNHSSKKSNQHVVLNTRIYCNLIDSFTVTRMFRNGMVRVTRVVKIFAN
ncbi:MAG: hypothetical protein UV63_C0004G0019 [Microgenomates group bacterium GW2011_GWC1_43_11]|uniref:Uncharacterized protein n=1 Tax=Candidatus Gottesmanbacteria bacterium GW2011_GWB1_44_11c TaxID=1618447 RepID=A0A0G1IXX3_9BACT|nr:MAG: hypothetical protein UV63_C0004G0019 [Microgenomates group bacterium GW2011_GWC1_43_11]KKT36622.1 MAG: hypothetical protein UW22_C0036G0010 [Candidatus Gottesmanbacteria bacterium GW2011_GWB1_44_11c]